MIKSKVKISFFMACNLFMVALLAIPDFEVGLKSPYNQQEFTDGDHIKLLGYTKTEIGSSQLNIDISLKENKAINYFSGEGHFNGTFLFLTIFSNQHLLFYKATVQSALKALLFPFHTFW